MESEVIYLEQNKEEAVHDRAVKSWNHGIDSGYEFLSS
jgi:hypothetical protein